jgi:hypothetical protein
MLDFLKDIGFSPFTVGFSSAILYSYKIWKEHQEKTLNTSKEQLDSIIDLFSNTEKLKNVFLVEQVFQYKFKQYIPASVIFFLLKTKNPTLGINNYLYARRYLNFSCDDQILEYASDIKNSDYRKVLKRRYFIGYAICGFVGLMLLFSANSIIKNIGFEWFVTSIPFIFYFLANAVGFLVSGHKILIAEELINTLKSRDKTNNYNVT